MQYTLAFFEGSIFELAKLSVSCYILKMLHFLVHSPSPHGPWLEVFFWTCLLAQMGPKIGTNPMPGCRGD
jgi:hypothetical protein